jgi:hypothetical protein
MAFLPVLRVSLIRCHIVRGNIRPFGDADHIFCNLKQKLPRRGGLFSAANRTYAAGGFNATITSAVETGGNTGIFAI